MNKFNRHHLCQAHPVELGVILALVSKKGGKPLAQIAFAAFFFFTHRTAPSNPRSG